MYKVCSQCKIKKHIDGFHNCKSKPGGKFSACKECRNSHNRERNEKIGYDELYRRAKEKDPEKYRKSRQEYYLNNRDKVLKRVKKYKGSDPEKVRQQRKNEYAKNKSKYVLRAKGWSLKNPEKRREVALNYFKRIYKDEAYRPVLVARKLISRVLGCIGNKKEQETFALLGYSAEDLRLHMEKKFRPGMKWENHGEWHVDHISPVSKMVQKGITDPAKINALSNLQPLWASENLSKNNHAE